MIGQINFLTSYLINLPLLQLGIGVLFGIVSMRYGAEVINFAPLVVLSILMLTRQLKMILCLIILSFGMILGVLRYDQIYGEGKIKEVRENFDNSVNELTIISDGEKGQYNMSYVATNREIDGKVLLKLDRNEKLSYGDILSGEFRLEQPQEIDEFDYEFYLNTQGIFYTSKVFDFEKIGYEDSVYARLSHFRVAMGQRLRRVLPEPHASLVAGLLWGERANMPENFKENLSRTGTTHIIAVSGFNVSIIVVYVLKLAGLLPRRVVVGLTIIVLSGFLLLVGLDNLPAFRAGVMGFAVLASKGIGRKTSFLSIISIAVMVLLAINPLALFTVSFQLSFAAMFGIVALTRPLEAKLEIVPKKIRSEMATTISAILATAPITVLNFESFSIVALIVNLFVLPLIPLLSLLGLINLYMDKMIDKFCILIYCVQKSKMNIKYLKIKL